MAHEAAHADLSPEELKFRDLIHRGDDYHKIELYRWALHYYKLALEMPLKDDQLASKIAIVQQKIKKETRTILIVLAVAAVLVLAVWLLT